jgi:hypothetical protein
VPKCQKPRGHSGATGYKELLCYAANMVKRAKSAKNLG